MFSPKRMRVQILAGHVSITTPKKANQAVVCVGDR
jgi:hypothetical protein